MCHNANKMMIIFIILELPRVINMLLLHIISIHYPANKQWENSNLSGRSFNLDLHVSPNSRYWLRRKCVLSHYESERVKCGNRDTYFFLVLTMMLMLWLEILWFSIQTHQKREKPHLLQVILYRHTMYSLFLPKTLH